MPSPFSPLNASFVRYSFGFVRSLPWLCIWVLAALAAAGPRDAMAQCNTYSVGAGPATYIPGTTDTGNHGDEEITTVPLPFPVSLYGVLYSNSVNVSSNGFLEFGDVAQSFSHNCLPSSAFSVPVIFPHWDDSDTSIDSSDGVFTSLSGTADSQTFVIEWKAFSYTSGAENDFEVIFHENQPYFDVVYHVTDSGAVATVGVQQSGGGSVTQFSCGTDSLSNDLSIRFTCATLVNPGSCCSGATSCALASQSDCPAQYFSLGGTCTANPCQPAANDLCSGAVDLTSLWADNAFPYHVMQDLAFVTTDILDSQYGPLEYYYGAWFKFTSPGPGTLVYSDPQSPSAVPLFTPIVDCGDPETINYHEFERSTMLGRAQYSFTSANQSVMLLVSQGPFDGQYLQHYDLTFDFIPAVAPVNDDCSHATDLNLVTFPYEVTEPQLGATDDVTACATFLHGIWFTYTPQVDGQMQCTDNRASDFSVPSTYPLAAIWGTVSTCGSPMTCLGDDSQPRYITVHAGQPVKIVVGYAESPIDFDFPLTINIDFTPTCPADFDGNNAVNVSDIFAFLRAWFAHSTTADIDENSVVNVSDIFAFLRHWFAHC